MEMGSAQPVGSQSDFLRAPQGRSAARRLLAALREGQPVVLLTGQFLDASHLLDLALARLGPHDPRIVRLSPPFPTARGVQQRLQALVDGPDRDALAEPAQVAQALLLLPAPTSGAAPVTIVVDRAETAPESLLRYLWLMHSLTSLGRVTLQLVLAGQDAIETVLATPMLAGLRGAVSLRLAAPRPATPLDLRLGEDAAAEPRGELAAEPNAATVPARVVAPIGFMPRRRWYVAAGLAACVALGGFDTWLSVVGQPHRGSVPRPTPILARVQPAAVAPQAPGPPRHAMAAAAPAGITALQARFEVASLDQPPASLLDRWQPPHPTPPPIPVPPPAATPTIASLPPIGPVVRVSVPVLPPALRDRADSAAPLLVMADATVPKVSVLFTLGDPRSEARARATVQALRQDGLLVGDPQALARPLPRSTIGYFFAADRPGAELVAHALAPILGAAGLTSLPMPSDLPPPGAMRVVIGSR